MSILRYFADTLCSLYLMIILLTTSVEAVTYQALDYYEKEYAKCNVTADANMEMDNSFGVTKGMMAFLRGDRADLHMETMVDGVQRRFFNERKIAHTVDMQGLFLAASMIRKICLAVAAVCVTALFLLKSSVKEILPKSICAGTGLPFALICALAGIISTNFNKYFVMFHHIFFNNDLQILDSTTNLLIDIVPEPFFMDTTARIALTYGTSVLTLSLAYFFYLHRQKR